MLCYSEIMQRCCFGVAARTIAFSASNAAIGICDSTAQPPLLLRVPRQSFRLVRVFSNFSDASDSRSQVRYVLKCAYHGREGRKKEGRKKGIGVNVLIGKRKEDVEVEEVKEGRVTAEDYCREWLRVDRGQCARRGVHTIRCLDLARRRVDEAAKHGVGSRRAPSRRRCCPSVLFNTSHLSISHYPLFTFY